MIARSRSWRLHTAIEPQIHITNINRGRSRRATTELNSPRHLEIRVGQFSTRLILSSFMTISAPRGTTTHLCLTQSLDDAMRTQDIFDTH